MSLPPRLLDPAALCSPVGGCGVSLAGTQRPAVVSRRHAGWLGLSLGLLLTTATAQGYARPDETSVLPRASASAQPTQARVKELMQEARDLYDAALKHRRREHPERITLTQRAISTALRAIELDPTQVANRVTAAEWMSRPELGEASVKRALVELQEARKHDPLAAQDYDIAGALALCYSHLGRFADAIAEYDRALLRLSGEPDFPQWRKRQQQATLLSNSAEAMMALGRLDEAIRRYSEADQLDGSDNNALHALGLAVAYDRDGQMQKSREALQRSLAADPALRMYQSDEVFFAPEGDRHYYDGLIAEALDNRDDAMRSFKEFLAELPQSRYAERARFHLEELRKLPGIATAELIHANIMMAPPHFGTEDSTGPRHHRPEEDIQRVTRLRQIELRYCYAKALRKAPKLGGDLALDLVLNRDGAVLMVQPLENTLSEKPSNTSLDRVLAGSTPPAGAAADLLHCVVSTVQRWRFSSADEGNVTQDEVALPMRFQAR